MMKVENGLILIESFPFVLFPPPSAWIRVASAKPQSIVAGSTKKTTGSGTSICAIQVLKAWPPNWKSSMSRTEKKKLNNRGRSWRRDGGIRETGIGSMVGIASAWWYHHCIIHLGGHSLFCSQYNYTCHIFMWVQRRLIIAHVAISFMQYY